MPFTFKKEPRETGLRATGNPNPDTIIQLNKRWVGSISGPNWNSKDDKWGISFMVNIPSSENCPWSWRRIKKRFDTEPEARQYLKDHFEELQKLDLHTVDLDLDY